ISTAPTVTPSPMSILTPSPMSILTPSPMTSRSYEAESQQNTRGSGTRVLSCSFCSGEKRVGNISYCSKNSLQFNNVWEPTTGDYTLIIYYVITRSNTTPFSMSVNGRKDTTVDVSSTVDNSTIRTVSVTVHLDAGNNTIEFLNHSQPYWAPDI